MKTYITITFNSEGSSPSEIKTLLMNLGFKAAKGSYDFVYDWNEESELHQTTPLNLEGFIFYN